MGLESRRCSSGGVSVLVDDSCEDRGPQESAGLKVLDATGLFLDVGWSLASRPVWSVPVVVLLVLGEAPSGVRLVHDQNVVEGLAANDPDRFRSERSSAEPGAQ